MTEIRVDHGEYLLTDLTNWSIGPFHGALPGPMRMHLRLDGEIIVSCSTETGFTRPGGSRATSSATEPLSTQAVASVTAPSTPTAAWQSCGMKVRLQMPPPAFGGAIRDILGTTFLRTSPRFIAGPACSRIDSMRAFSSLSALSASRVS